MTCEELDDLLRQLITASKNLKLADINRDSIAYSECLTAISDVRKEIMNKIFPTGIVCCLKITNERNKDFLMEWELGMYSEEMRDNGIEFRLGDCYKIKVTGKEIKL